MRSGIILGTVSMIDGIMIGTRSIGGDATVVVTGDFRA